MPPPLFFAAGFFAGYLLDRLFVPIRLSLLVAPRGLTIAGVSLMLLGVALAVWGVLTFRRARTTFLPFRPASALVRGGPYRFTRNPMYLGMAAGYVGLALALDTAWPLFLIPAVLYLLVTQVVRREESYLEATFGENYRDFTRNVRRWL